MPSNTPPTSTVPITAPYPYRAATALMGTMKVKLTPMKMGSPEPTFHRGVDWIKVAMPAAIMAFWIRIRISSWDREGLAAAATMPMGTMFVTNMARICCREKGSALSGLTLPVSERRGLLFMLCSFQRPGCSGRGAGRKISVWVSPVTSGQSGTGHPGRSLPPACRRRISLSGGNPGSAQA